MYLMIANVFTLSQAKKKCHRRAPSKMAWEPNLQVIAPALAKDDIQMGFHENRSSFLNTCL
jgi:hypothetical protein